MKTVVGLFDTFQHAQSAAEALENAGIPRGSISVVANNQSGHYDQYADTSSTTANDHTSSAAGAGATTGTVIGGVTGLLMGLGLFVIPGFGPIAAAGWLVSTITGAGIGAVAGGLIGALTHAGVPEEDAVTFNEGVKRGGTLLAVKAEDTQATEVAQILGDYGAVDIDQRGGQYRQESTPAVVPVVANVQATHAPMPPTPAMNVNTTQNTANRTVAREGETVLPVVEEELQVGKRQVEQGGVRVYTHTTERPVEETVQLHEEHVNVERRPVDRPVGADTNAFQDQTIEVREMSEQVVASKQARVVEEVVVNKESTNRTEMVHDTVRRTDVDVEQIGNEHTGRSGSFDAYDTDYRSNFTSAFAGRGLTYEQVSPAYQYGQQLAANPQYKGRDWSSIESEVQRDWETRQPGTWDKMKAAVSYAWNRASATASTGVANAEQAANRRGL